nr:hypothetical protein [Tanacetum cinerariifolium]
KGDPILENQRPQPLVTPPLEVREPIPEKSPSQKTIEKPDSKIAVENAEDIDANGSHIKTTADDVINLSDNTRPSTSPKLEEKIKPNSKQLVDAEEKTKELEGKRTKMVAELARVEVADSYHLPMDTLLKISLDVPTPVDVGAAPSTENNDGRATMQVPLEIQIAET